MVANQQREEGFEFNSKTNGIALDAARHPGSHGSYTKAINEAIESTKSANPKWSAKQVLERVVSDTRQTIESTSGEINDIFKKM